VRTALHRRGVLFSSRRKSYAPIMTIEILSHDDARERYADFVGVLTLEDIGEREGLRIQRGQNGGMVGPHQLIVRCVDLDVECQGSIDDTMVMIATGFGKELARKGPLLIHDANGRSLAPAFGLGIIARLLGPGKEREAVEELLRIRPDEPDDILGPNLYVLKRLDAILEREGRLFDAWMAWEARNWSDLRCEYRSRRMVEAVEEEAPELVP